ncbi:MAG: acyltransferase [bacterium]|nr:acyltransferase [bacterium]
MIKPAIKEIGLSKALKYIIGNFCLLLFNLMFISPLRVLYLKLFGVKIGQGTVIENITFINLYRTGLKGLKIGSNCFIGAETMLDLAGQITIYDNVTIAERVTILTHMNVGYKSHPLQKYYPSTTKNVIIESGVFIGTGSIILPGVKIHKNSLIGAGSVVNSDVGSNSVVAGVPAKLIKRLEDDNVEK